MHITHTIFELNTFLTFPTFAVITGSTDGIGKAYAREVRTKKKTYDKELDLLDKGDNLHDS